MDYHLQIAARTIWCEARGETEEGQRAVAHVLVNRLRSKRWGSNLAALCLAPFQFSCWNTRDPNRIAAASLPDNNPALLKMAAMIEVALDDGDHDPTDGSTHYYNPKVVPDPPAWTKPPAIQTAVIGNHVFFKNVA